MVPMVPRDKRIRLAQRNRRQPQHRAAGVAGTGRRSTGRSLDGAGVARHDQPEPAGGAGVAGGGGGTVAGAGGPILARPREIA